MDQEKGNLINVGDLCSKVMGIKLEKSEDAGVVDIQVGKGEGGDKLIAKTEISPAVQDESDTESDNSGESYSTAQIEIGEECVEGENIIAEHRAKLFRLNSEEKRWDERGVGQIRLLQSLRNSKKCRVTMWRDGNGLLACNFSLFPAFQVSNFQNNPKALTWKCYDNCFGENWEIFCCKFASEEDCASFKAKLIQYALDPPEVPNLILSIISENENTDNYADARDDVDEAEEDDAEAEEDEPQSECSGCRGCKSEFVFPKPLPRGEEPVISCDLNENASKDVPDVVLPSMFL